jgi:hypothetical protein
VISPRELVQQKPSSPQQKPNPPQQKQSQAQHNPKPAQQRANLFYNYFNNLRQKSDLLDCRIRPSTKSSIHQCKTARGAAASAWGRIAIPRPTHNSKVAHHSDNRKKMFAVSGRPTSRPALVALCPSGQSGVRVDGWARH